MATCCMTIPREDLDRFVHHVRGRVIRTNAQANDRVAVIVHCEKNEADPCCAQSFECRQPKSAGQVMSELWKLPVSKG